MYIIQLKVPFAGHAILPRLGGNILTSPETDKLRTKRENVGTRLEAITGKKPEWNKRKYQYTAELTDTQVEEVKGWEYVRSVKKVE
jgi:hypothetical protein